MNRRQRREAARAGRRDAPQPRETGAESAGEVKPGFLLRLFANIVLSPWVLRRVNHADVENLLAGVALQAGRPEIARELLRRTAMRKKGGDGRKGK